MTPDFSRVILATGNPGKISEIRQLLSGLEVDLRSLADFADLEPAVEDAPTLEGNAVKKARHVFEHTGIPSLADDTGLEVDALRGAPGVHSARFAGPECDAARNRDKLRTLLEAVTDRNARFRTVVALVHSGGVETFTGICEGHIIREERGANGFGYDALFVPSGFTETFAEMDPMAKNRISHRGEALRKVRAYLEHVMSARTES